MIFSKELFILVKQSPGPSTTSQCSSLPFSSSIPITSLYLTTYFPISGVHKKPCAFALYDGRVWFRQLGLVSAVWCGFSSCAWFQLLCLVSAAGFGFSCWVWFQLLGLVSAAVLGFSCCAWFQLLGLVSAAGFGFSCWVWFQLLGLVSAAV